MDGVLSRGFPCGTGGGARRALPLFLLGLGFLLASPRAWALTDPLDMSSSSASSSSAPPTSLVPSVGQSPGAAVAPGSGAFGGLDGGVTVLYSSPAELDSGPRAAGFPSTGGLWMLWGGGAVVYPAPLRVGVSAWHGTLAASSGGASTAWTLNLAALNLEQVYPVADFLLTAGANLEAGELDGSLLSATALDGVTAGLFGYGVDFGVRWPAQTPLGLFLRGGWEELYGSGRWNGPSAPGRQLFELGGPTATLELELNL